MPEAASAQEITLTRVFDAPRQLVWDAWTDPEQLAKWWGRRGWSTPPSSVTIDLRPGGVFRLLSFSDEDGTQMPTEGVFREVVEPERLVFAERSEDSWHDGAVSSVTFTDLGDGRTEMVLHSTIHTTDEMRRQAEAGMASAIDRLAEHLGGRRVEYRLEVVVVPVADVDRAKAFYSDRMGFDVDHDRDHGGGVRVVQLTPPGSGCSIVIGTGLAPMEPGSVKGLQLVVSDMDAAVADLGARGLDVGDVQTLGGFRFVFFNDPDGNGWAVQEIKR
jgi:uncharacterized protein YndB with AHSA1/START domain